MTRLTLCLVMICAACGGDDGTTKKDAAVDSPGVHADAPTDGKVFLDGPPGTTPLTVKNVLSWCEVFPNNAATGSTDPSILINVTPGVIPVKARAKPGTMPANNNSLFKIVPNMWHHTDGDSGTGDTGTVTGSMDAAESAVVVTVDATAKCIWVCCPFKDGTGCPTTEQCN